MKWPALKSKREKLQSSEEKDCYAYFDNEDGIQRVFGLDNKLGKNKGEFFWHEDPEDNEHLWVTHKLPYRISVKQQRDYKIFCSGWLQFYDEIVRSGLVDHLIYFVWSEHQIKNKTRYSVSIYLTNPPPLKRKIKKQLTESSQKSAEDGKGGAGSDTLEQVDPPRVPPPPPPPES